MLKPDINDYSQLVNYLEQALRFYKAESPKHERSHDLEGILRDWITEARIWEKLAITHPASRASLVEFLGDLQKRYETAQGVNYATLGKWVSELTSGVNPLQSPRDLLVFEQPASSTHIPLNVFLRNMKHQYEATNRSTETIDKWLLLAKQSRITFDKMPTTLEFLETILCEYETAHGYEELVDGVRALIRPRNLLADTPAKQTVPVPSDCASLQSYLKAVMATWDTQGVNYETLGTWVSELTSVDTPTTQAVPAPTDHESLVSYLNATKRYFSKGWGVESARLAKWIKDVERLHQPVDCALAKDTPSKTQQVQVSEPPPVMQVTIHVYEVPDIREKAYFDQLAKSEAVKPKPQFSVTDAPALVDAIFSAIQNRG